MIETECNVARTIANMVFHADPHPGNLLALEDGRLCYLFWYDE